MNGVPIWTAVSRSLENLTWKGCPIEIHNYREVVRLISENFESEGHDTKAIDSVTYASFIDSGHTADRLDAAHLQWWPRYRFAGMEISFTKKTASRRYSGTVYHRELAVCWVYFNGLHSMLTTPKTWEEYREEYFDEFVAKLYIRMMRQVRSKKRVQRYKEYLEYDVVFPPCLPRDHQYPEGNYLPFPWIVGLEDPDEDRANICRLILTW